MLVIFLLLGRRLVWVVRGGHDRGSSWRPQGSELLHFFAVPGGGLLGDALHHLGGPVAQLEELLVYLVLEQLHILYGLVDGVFLDVIARHLEGRGTGGCGQGCDLTGVARGYWLVSDMVLDGLPAVGRYADLLRVTLCHLRLTQSCLHWLDLLLLGDG